MLRPLFTPGKYPVLIVQEVGWTPGLELWENQTWMLYHDNAPAHASRLIRSYLAKHQPSVVPHQPYSPDVAPADIFLFPKIKTALKGRRFQTIEEIQ